MTNLPALLLELHYKDYYPKGFDEFRKKYMKLIRDKTIYPFEIFVQFTDHKNDVLDRTVNKNPNHKDPVGNYAYPLDYVLKYPMDIWYGASARYLRVLKTTAKNVLWLNDLSWNEAQRIAYRMGLKDDLKWIARFYKHKGRSAPAKALLSVVQMDHDAEPSDTGRMWPKKEYPMRTGLEQTELFLKAGYDAIRDDATNANSAIINDQEPKQIIFLTRNSFRVKEIFDLHIGKSKYHNTVHEPHPFNVITFMRKIAANIAISIDDKLSGKVRTINLGGWHYYWTKKGRRIEIIGDRPDSYYDQKGFGSKPHKYDKTYTNHIFKAVIQTEYGTLGPYVLKSKDTFDSLYNEIYRDYQKAKRSGNTSNWQPENEEEFERKYKEEMKKRYAKQDQ